MLQACDECRQMKLPCTQRGQCGYCVSKDLVCEYTLAMLNGHYQQGYHPRNTALQDYQMQLMLLEQQKKKRFWLAQQVNHSNVRHFCAQSVIELQPLTIGLLYQASSSAAGNSK